MAYDIPTMVSEATGVLKSLIAIPSLSRDEEKAADYLQNYIELQGMATGRKGNNVWCLSPMFAYNSKMYRRKFRQYAFDTSFSGNFFFAGSEIDEIILLCGAAKLQKDLQQTDNACTGIIATQSV